ncbi:MAG: AMP-binding protein, partial [Motiliproteus sp.]
MKDSLNSYTRGPTDTALLTLTIGDMFDQTVAQYPDNPALIVPHQNIRWSYRELQQQVNQCAKAMISLGIEQGDRVGIWSPNNAQWCISQLATAKIGAILVTINPAYRLHELEYALNHSQCSYLIAADKFKDSNYSLMLQQLLPELNDCPPSPRCTLQSATIPSLKTVITLAESATKGMLPWQQLLGLAEEVSEQQLRRRQTSLNCKEAINIQYTSGTTGAPKGATLSHYNILNNGRFVAENQKLSSADKLVIPVPLYHCFGMVMGNLGCLTQGATMIYPGEGFNAAEVLLALEQEQATALYGVPTMFIALLQHPDFSSFNLSSLRTGIMAGASCPIEVMKRVIKKMHMDEVQIAYGMTETSPVSSQTCANDPIEKRVSSVGRTHPHLENKIISANGELVPRGQIGELCTRGYSVM